MLHTGNTVRPLSHDTCVRILALGHLTSRRSCPGSWLWAVSNFVAFCPDWPPAVGPKIHIFCPDRDQGFPAIARGPACGGPHRCWHAKRRKKKLITISEQGHIILSSTKCVPVM
ncbi:hypothetical protein K443DRAFT_481162 [Laccaria amethystina LaAM-08-1]|uniref:Uncharacterized protein n=1 Tax=Laccaria amethystina LaAM-08-1 TaxID=1095629 RepID=A0A0C9Y063_9AGAR|nr:hypothetical protein K443DRAFT_481162 [Laccaria amethystina LaAM-08-1]